MRARLNALASLASGLLFGAGLVVSGMSNPRKVLGFLDVFGAWDPSLAFVMAGAVGVHSVAYRLIRRRSAPVVGKAFSLPAPAPIDRRLVSGAAVFGVGWGLAGYCPGPAVVALPGGHLGTLVLFVGMLLGSFAVTKIRRSSGWSPASRAAAEPQLPGLTGP